MNALSRTLMLSLCLTIAVPALAVDNRERLEAEEQAQQELFNSHLVSLALKAVPGTALILISNFRSHEEWNARKDLEAARRQTFEGVQILTQESKVAAIALAQEEVSEARKHLLQTQNGAPGNSLAQAERRMSEALKGLEDAQSLRVMTAERLEYLKATQPGVIEQRKAAYAAAKKNRSWARFGFRVLGTTAGAVLLADTALEITYLAYGYNSYSPLLDLVAPSAPPAANADDLL